MSTPITLDDIWALFQETDCKFQDTAKEIRETELLIKEVGQQLSRLGEKFGGFNERLALFSMQKILRQRFGVDTISPSVRLRREGQHLEIDVLAYANDDINAAYVVEVKSHLREADMEQLLKILERFPAWFPEHRDKALYGILAAVDIPDALISPVLAQGLYLARIHDDLFEMQVPNDFQARRFDNARSA
jgi:hypothetical protein